MGKRQHGLDGPSHDPSQPPTPSMKRARTLDSDSEPDHTQLKTNGKGKKRATEHDSDEDVESDVELQVEEEMDDEEFENRYTDKVRTLIEHKPRGSGTVADYGIIEKVEVHHFMCHRYLTFTFGPQINFIIGHNGSGKSAVLSAITVALGGKASATGRGNGLKAFIKEGQNVSEVTIHIKNEGEEAYKPKDFGKSIVITRRFTRDGASSWKIKSKDGKVISTKKEELAAICDHMNIQVDNPMNILTQDSARQFLSASTPADKYKFFLRGTQLSQLSEEYELCLENVNRTAKILASKMEVLPDLERKLKDATIRYNEASKAREQKVKLEEVTRELAWAHVRDKEDELGVKLKEISAQDKRLPKIQETIRKSQATLDELTEEVEQVKAKLDSLESVEHLTTRQSALKQNLSDNKKKIEGFRSELKEMDGNLKAVNLVIEGLTRNIEEETRKLELQTQKNHAEIQSKVDSVSSKLAVAEATFQGLVSQKKEAAVAADRVKQEGESLGKTLEDMKKEIANCDSMISNARRREQDALVPYGKNIRGVLEQIQRMPWHGEVPLGPLGVHVKAKDPKIWGDLLRNQLSGLLTAFAVTDGRDSPKLKKLLMDSGNAQTSIVIYDPDLFDYSSGEPPEHILTVLRALEISHPNVVRIMINSASIERQVLDHTRQGAEAALRQTRGGSAWTLDKFHVRVFPEGGSSSTRLNFRQQSDAMSLLLSGRDTAGEIAHYTARKMELEGNYRDTNAQIQELRAQYKTMRGTIDRLAREEEQSQRQIRELNIGLTSLRQEAEEELPVNVGALEDARREALEEKNGLLRQFEAVESQKQEIDAQQKELLTQAKDVKAQLDERAGIRSALNREIEEIEVKKVTKDHEKKGYEKKLAEEKEKLATLNVALEATKQEYENWTKHAMSYGEPLDSPGKTKDLTRQHEALKKALQEREKRHGASVEDMAREVEQADNAFNKAKTDLKQMQKLNKTLRLSLLTRLARWQEFRRHIALRCKIVFAYHLSQRGYYGKIMFNHTDGTLTLRVQTDDQLQTEGQKDKDPRSLSGGEKSFSTICLLLSLWDSIGCPLRCLDEFDVFMDAVNRRISMKMMIDTANSSDKKQYILITPQDMTNVTFGPTVKVLRMPDPERAPNATLPFTAATA